MISNQKRDYYEILEVNKESSFDEIKKSYRKLALENHPDRNHGNKDAENKFKEIAEAYEILGDPEKRKKYDMFGHNGVNAQNFSSTSDIFNHFQDIFSFTFGGDFGFNQRNRGPLKGNDIKIDVQVSFEDIISGKQIELKIPNRVKCEVCHGSGIQNGFSFDGCYNCSGTGKRINNNGFMQVISTCNVCGGRGKINNHPCESCKGSSFKNEYKNLMLTLPSNIKNGNKLRLSGQGEKSINGGPDGDLYVNIYLTPHEKFSWFGDDLMVSVNIGVVQAILGGKIKIPIVDKEIEVLLHEGIQPGDILNVGDLGLTYPKMRGISILLKINVIVPTKLNDEQKTIINKFGNALLMQ